jgi:hypothetical protein
MLCIRSEFGAPSAVRQRFIADVDPVHGGLQHLRAERLALAVMGTHTGDDIGGVVAEQYSG